LIEKGLRLSIENFQLSIVNYQFHLRIEVMRKHQDAER
jgi:hypothetical protein